MKRINSVAVFSIISFILCAPLAAAGKANSAAGELHVGVLNGPTAIPVARMFDKIPDLGGTKVTFEKCADPAALLPRMIKGEIDIGFLPANVAAKAYNAANGAIICAGISGNGNLFLLTKDKTIKTLTDLCGKKVSVAGQGATPEYLLRWMLAQQKIEIGSGSDKVDLDFSIPTPNLAAELIAGKIDYALVPEPFATVALMKSAAVVRAIDFQDLYATLEGAGASYPLTVMVVRKQFAESNPDTVHAFMTEFDASMKWTLKNPQRAGILIQNNTLGLMAPVVANAIPHCNFVWMNAEDSRPSIERLLEIFLQFAPDAIGGKLPDDGFYFK